MYPGLKMKLRWMLLENAKWPEGYTIPDEIQSNITKSRDRWNASDPSESIVVAPLFLPRTHHQVGTVIEEHINEEPVSAAPVEKEKRPKSMDAAMDVQQSDLEDLMEAIVTDSAQQMDLQIPAAAKRELTALATQMTNTHMRLARCDKEAGVDDMVSVTVVKVSGFGFFVGSHLHGFHFSWNQ